MPLLPGPALITAVPVLAAGRVIDIAGDKTTTSTTFVDVAGATLNLTTGARRLFVSVTANGGNNTAGKYTLLDLVLDGVSQGGTFGLMISRMPSSAIDTPLGFTYLTDVLTATSHTIKLQWRVDANTGTIYASATAPLVFAALEV